MPQITIALRPTNFGAQAATRSASRRTAPGIIRHFGTARTGAYFSSAPFIGAVIAIPLLHETPTSQLLGAGALMGFGLWIHLAERHDHEHSHDVPEHDHAHVHVHDEHHRLVHDGPITEPHTNRHRHEPMRHRHAHYPDLHHRHGHG